MPVIFFFNVFLTGKMFKSDADFFCRFIVIRNQNQVSDILPIKPGGLFLFLIFFLPVSFFAFADFKIALNAQDGAGKRTIKPINQFWA